MKHGKRPTYEQKKLMTKYKLNYEDWLVYKVTSDGIHIVHRLSDKTTKVIPTK